MVWNTQALHALDLAVADRDAAAMWTVVPAVEDCCEAAPILAEQLLAEWHECHEDIVFILGTIGDPRTVEAISIAILIPFEGVVKWNNLREFQRAAVSHMVKNGIDKWRVALWTLTVVTLPFEQSEGGGAQVLRICNKGRAAPLSGHVKVEPKRTNLSGMLGIANYASRGNRRLGSHSLPSAWASCTFQAEAAGAAFRRLSISKWQNGLYAIPDGLQLDVCFNFVQPRPRNSLTPDSV